jgi:hypothetical protein
MLIPSQALYPLHGAARFQLDDFAHSQSSMSMTDGAPFVAAFKYGDIRSIASRLTRDTHGHSLAFLGNCLFHGCQPGNMIAGESQHGSRTIIDGAEVIHAEDPLALMRSFSRAESCSKSNKGIHR